MFYCYPNYCYGNLVINPRRITIKQKELGLNLGKNLYEINDRSALIRMRCLILCVIG